MRKIGIEDLDNIAWGAAFLGSGGGGSPYLGKLIAEEAIRQYGNVSLIDIDELSDEDLIIPVADMGAPTVCQEKLFTIQSHIKALTALENHIGRKAKAVVSLEVGGLNSIVPVVTAAALNLPLIDGDAMGRAFPEIQMVTHTIFGIPASPMAVADDRGNTVILNATSNLWVEKLARSVTTEMGLSTSVACYSGLKKQLAPAIIRGSISYAEKIGRHIRSSEAGSKPALKALQKITKGQVLFSGKISRIRTTIHKGFNRGEITVSDMARHMTIQIQNEYLIASEKDRILATTPDIIAILEEETCTPLLTDSVKYGQRVVVLGVPCDKSWRTEKGLELVGPRYFGYDTDYIPVEKR